MTIAFSLANLNNIFPNFLQGMKNVYKWFVYSLMKANLDKFQFILRNILS